MQRILGEMKPTEAEAELDFLVTFGLPPFFHARGTVLEDSIYNQRLLHECLQ